MRARKRDSRAQILFHANPAPQALLLFCQRHTLKHFITSHVWARPQIGAGQQGIDFMTAEKAILPRTCDPEKEAR